MPLATVTNLGLFAIEIEGGGSLWAINVREDLQESDLNADGDQDDSLLYVYDSAMQVLHATNLQSSGAFLVDGGFGAFSVLETDADLNGDGDLQDAVLYLFDASSGEATSLGLAGNALAFVDGHLVVLVNEAAQGEDLDLDGGLGDEIVQVLRPATDERWNTGLSQTGRLVEVRSGFLAMIVEEEGLEQDRNGDGDEDDGVVALLELRTREILNTGLATVFDARSCGNSVGIFVSEEAQGNRDLDGDGDAFDFVLFIYSAVSRTAARAPMDASRLLDAGDGRFALRVSEAGFDLNGDGDRDDQVAFLYEPGPDLLVPTGLALDPLAPSAVFVDGELMVLCSESAQGEDLNGDRDREDHVLHVVDSAGRVRNTRVPATSAFPRSNQLDLGRDEASEHRDWNGDGDQQDTILFVFDPRTSVFSNLHVSLFHVIAQGEERVLLRLFEQEAGADLNDDGDEEDVTFVLQDIVTGLRENTGLGNDKFLRGQATADGSFLFSASERLKGADLNGDADLDDFVLHVAD